MVQKEGARMCGGGKRMNPTKSQQKLMAKKSAGKMSQEHGRIKKAGLAVKRLTGELTGRGEQLVDFSDDPRAIHGAKEFYKNMLNGTPFSASSTSCAELSKIEAQGKGAGPAAASGSASGSTRPTTSAPCACQRTGRAKRSSSRVATAGCRTPQPCRRPAL